MNVKINSVNFDADSKLKTFVNQKVNKLSQFYEDILNADVYLKVENNQDLENKISEIKLDIPGSPLFAKKQGKTFEESTDAAVDALRRQLTKHKEKLRRV
jgi:putative sigma-54 modulation protein